MKVKQLMSSNLCTLAMDDSLEKAQQIFNQTHFHHLLVVQEKVLMGLFTDSDLFQNITPTLGTSNESHRDIALGNQPVHKIMSRDLVVISEEKPISEAIDLFYEKNISCLPVVNEANEAVGILTWRDIIKLLAKRSQMRRKKKLKAIRLD